MARQPLGRGLSALLGDEPQPMESQTELGVDQIEPNSEQPRTRFTEKALDELAQSIKANGIVQPIVVRKHGKGYQIVAGERRWRAAQRAGLRKIPVVMRDVSDDQLLELALIENIQRQELNPVEEARAYRKLIDTVGLTQEKLSERVGKERTLIATTLRLLKLPDEVLNLIEDEKISAGHGRALLMADSEAIQIRVARQIAERAMSVRETERVVRKETSNEAQTIDNKEVVDRKDPNITSAETKMQRRLGTKVSIIPNKNGGGKFEIEYYSQEDLDRIYQFIVHG